MLQFEPLLSSDNMTAVFVTLCAPSAQLTTYLTVPPGVNVDLDKVKSQFCSLDPQVIEQEVMDFFGVSQIEDAVRA
jgi:hypothetical protein